jgi:hypothetical protein
VEALRDVGAGYFFVFVVDATGWWSAWDVRISCGGEGVEAGENGRLTYSHIGMYS